MRLNLSSSPELARIVRAADNSYRKREASLQVRETVCLSGTYWDGGSRSTYVAVDLVTLRSSAAEQFAPSAFGGPAAAPMVRIPEGIAIVQTGVFCGKTANATVYINPVNAAKLLPA
jgi:hypothetical protein